MGLNESQVLFGIGTMPSMRHLFGVFPLCRRFVKPSAPFAIRMKMKRNRQECTRVWSSSRILAPPRSIKGEDVIRAYGPKAAKPDINAMIDPRLCRGRPCHDSSGRGFPEA